MMQIIATRTSLRSTGRSTGVEFEELIGRPHFGHAGAWSETSVLQSGHVARGMFPP